ncbi:hypothetical protein Taro_055989, partial [Colocasia esculenta]|nr:hypothetical protein [Colocasia esculenta]
MDHRKDRKPITMLVHELLKRLFKPFSSFPLLPLLPCTPSHHHLPPPAATAPAIEAAAASTRLSPFASIAHLFPSSRLSASLCLCLCWWRSTGEEEEEEEESMVGQHGLNLAAEIITAHFGDVVAKVCSCLLRRGSLSLQEIVLDTGISQSRVKNCLLVLIQHNCVQAYSIPRRVPGGAMPKAATQYMALFDNILHRMRFSKFLALVAGEFDDPHCETLLEGLLQHGRLTFEQLVMRATSRQSEGSITLRDSLRSSLDKLIHEHYFALETGTLEQQALAAAALLDAERFSGFGDGCGVNADGNLLEEKAGGNSVGANIGEKRKHEELELDKDTQAAINETEVLWRANFEKIVHCLKKKVCVTSVRASLSLDAAIVLEAMIESSNQKKPKANSVTSSLDDILEWVMKKPGGRLMTMQHVRACLEELKCNASTEETKALYSIDLGDIIEECKHEEVIFSSFLSLKYGKEAYRIFRLLVKRHRPIETDS